ncbi:MAG: DUF262 domain-containing HNH endonuclease family protein [Neomegalonema sp.]|nr:DUF262 domain-containing HNH endonuclease family protein [Neomegalonema sp.]
MSQDIAAQARPVGAILQSPNRFTVPSFQRPYAWHDEQALKLLGDLRLALPQSTEALESCEPYFIGALVMVRDPSDQSLEILDGQQRLVTLTMILAVMRDLDPELLASLSPHIHGPDGLPILTLRALDATFFAENVQRAGATAELNEDAAAKNDAQSHIVANTLVLHRELSSLAPEERRLLARFLLERTFAVEVHTPTDDQGFRVFTVMNDRGLELKDNDILKTELLGAIADERRAGMADLWEGLEAELGREQFGRLFSHIRSIHRPQRPRGSIFAELREALDPAADPEAFIRSELLPKGRLLRQFDTEAMRFATRENEINLYIRFLNRIANTDWVPLALAFFSKRERPSNEALTFLKALDQMAYGLYIQAADENLRIARYRPPLEALAAGAGLEELLPLMALSKHEKRIARQVLGGNIYQKERIRLAVLLRIDHALSDGVAWIEYGDVTVEHVLPQNPPPDSPWMQKFPDARQRRKLTNKLGNLALLTRRKNHDAANFPFERKKYEYFAKGGITPFAITTQLLQEDDWTPEVIERRHERLLRIACQIWDL